MLRHAMIARAIQGNLILVTILKFKKRCSHFPILHIFVTSQTFLTVRKFPLCRDANSLYSNECTSNATASPPTASNDDSSVPSATAEHFQIPTSTTNSPSLIILSSVFNGNLKDYDNTACR